MKKMLIVFSFLLCGTALFGQVGQAHMDGIRMAQADVAVFDSQNGGLGWGWYPNTVTIKGDDGYEFNDRTTYAFNLGVYLSKLTQYPLIKQRLAYLKSLPATTYNSELAAGYRDFIYFGDHEKAKDGKRDTYWYP